MFTRRLCVNRAEKAKVEQHAGTWTEAAGDKNSTDFCRQRGTCHSVAHVREAIAASWDAGSHGQM